MQYWKIVEAGDYKVYTRKLLGLFLQNRKEYFLSVNGFWNPISPRKLPLIIQNIPELSYLEENYSKIKELTLLVLTSDSSTLHTDHDISLNKGVKARLNLPVLNCNGSTTAFYYFPKSLYDLYNENEGKTKTWPLEWRHKFAPVTQVDLLQPTILRTSEPHTVFCHSCSFPRISLTISFEKDLVHLLDDENLSE